MTKTKFLLTILIIIGIAHGTIWRWRENFPGRSLQQAIADTIVDEFDTISVEHGTPQNPIIINENINFVGKNIVLINRDFLGGTNDPSTCIIDGSNLTGSVVTFNHRESLNAILKGFTIQDEYEGM